MRILVLLLFYAFSGAFQAVKAEENQPEAVPLPPEVPVESAAANTQGELSEEEQYLAWARALWASLDRQKGVIKLEKAGATLDVPEAFYYLDPEDTEKVLVEVWGNPPGQKTLGMLFPASKTPFDFDSWGVTLDYQEEGYVSDEDADEIDYDKMLATMKADTRSESEQRVTQGYGPMELIGWASRPFYDKSSHKLHWAQELNFGDEANTLNYNIRVLGRKGVLVLNFIAAMEQKQEIENSLDSVLALAEFDPGARYGDFNPDMDEIAAYGIGALVAGKVAAKTGFLVAALVFLKKFGVIALIAAGAIFAKVFRRKKPDAA